MSIEKDEKKEVDSCCTDSSCCMPIEDDEGKAKNICGQSSLSKIKTFIFVIIMLAAVGIAAMSILKKGSEESNKETAEKFNTNIASLDICGPQLESLNSLNDVAKDYDFVFMLLPGANKEETAAVASVIEKTAKTISKNGTKVGNFTIKTDSDDYEKLVTSYGIDSFPAILAMRKGCGSTIVTGDITEEKLLAGYVRASKPATCGPKPCGPK